MESPRRIHRIGLFECEPVSRAKLQPMNRFVRCVVMWLLVLALPVQGFAAATMLLCEAGHHGSTQLIDVAHDHGSHMHEAAHDGDAMDGSGGDHQASEAVSSRDGPAFTPMSAKHGKVTAKCGTCASCCTVAFLPTTVIAFIAPAPKLAHPVVELTTRVGFFTDGPDRPPRLHFA